MQMEVVFGVWHVVIPRDVDELGLTLTRSAKRPNLCPLGQIYKQIVNEHGALAKRFWIDVD